MLRRRQLSMCIKNGLRCIRPLITKEISNLSRQLADKVHIYKTHEHPQTPRQVWYRSGREMVFAVYGVCANECMHASVHLLSLTRQPSMLWKSKPNQHTSAGWKSARDAIMLCIWCRFARVLPLIGYCQRSQQRPTRFWESEHVFVKKHTHYTVVCFTRRVTQFRKNACHPLSCCSIKLAISSANCNSAIFYTIHTFFCQYINCY